MTTNARSTQGINRLSSSGTEEDTPFERSLKWIMPLGLILLTFIVYANTLGGDLLNTWGDNRYITENPLILDKQIGKIWTSAYLGEYIPLTQTSLLIDRTIWGSNAFGYHILNILLHIGNVLLTFYILQIITKRPIVGFIGAALFAVHPLQSETVAWISQRKTLLSAFFMLLALYLHLLHAQRRDRGWAVLGGWFSFALSMLASPITVLAPLTFISIDFLWIKRGLGSAIQRNMGYFVIALLGGGAAFMAQNAGGLPSRGTDNVLEAAQLILWTIWNYAASLFLPFNLNNLYFYDIARLSMIFPPVWLGIIWIIATLVLFIFQPFGKPFTRWSILWFWAFLLPVLNIIPTGITRSDYRLYLPALMLYGLLALALARLAEWRPERETRYAIFGVAGVLIALFSVLTVFRNNVWGSEAKLWENHLADYPTSPTGLYAAGLAAYNANDLQRSRQYLDELLRYYPNYTQGNAVRGSLALLTQDYIAAANFYNRALSQNPNNEEYRSSLGIALLQAGVQAFDAGQTENALNLYVQAVNFIPNEPILHNNIGFTLFSIGNFDEAIIAYNRALELNPRYTRAWINLGDAALNTSRYDLARTAYDNALNLGGTLNARSASNHCLSLGELGEEPERAVSFCQQAIDLEPNNSLYYGRAAHVLLLFNQAQSALPVAQKSVELEPNLALNQRVLGDAYALTGNFEGARLAYETALQLNPNNQKALEGLAALENLINPE